MSDRDLKHYLHPIVAIILPAGQAAVSAVAGFVVVSSVAWYTQASNPVAIGAAAGGVVFGLSWVLALSWWRSRIESTGGNSRPVTPAAIYPAESVVRVELSQDNGRVVDFLDWTGDHETLIRAAAYIRSRDFETSNLGGAMKPISRSEGESVRDWLIANDLARWVRPEAHTAGWGILPAGRAVIRRLHHLGISTGIVDPPPSNRPVITETEIYTRLQSHTDTQRAVYPAGLVAAGHHDDQDVINDLWR